MFGTEFPVFLNVLSVLFLVSQNWFSLFLLGLVSFLWLVIPFLPLPVAFRGFLLNTFLYFSLVQCTRFSLCARMES